MKNHNFNFLSKTCPKCQTDRSSDEFYKDRSRKDSLTVWCKSCCKATHFARHNERKQAMRQRYRDNRKAYLAYYKSRYVLRPMGSQGTIRYKARMAGFRSGFERTLDMQLKSHGVKYSYETMELPYTLESIYNPDFILENGIIIEAKGVLSVDDKRKMIAIKKKYPELDIRFVFWDAEKKIPRTKQTHAKWAEKNGFPFAHERIPESWMDE